MMTSYRKELGVLLITGVALMLSTPTMGLGPGGAPGMANLTESQKECLKRELGGEFPPKSMPSRSEMKRLRETCSEANDEPVEREESSRGKPRHTSKTDDQVKPQNRAKRSNSITAAHGQNEDRQQTQRKVHRDSLAHTNPSLQVQTPKPDIQSSSSYTEAQICESCEVSEANPLQDQVNDLMSVVRKQEREIEELEEELIDLNDELEVSSRESQRSRPSNSQPGMNLLSGLGAMFNPMMTSMGGGAMTGSMMPGVGGSSMGGYGMTSQMLNPQMMYGMQSFQRTPSLGYQRSYQSLFPQMSSLNNFQMPSLMLSQSQFMNRNTNSIYQPVNPSLYPRQQGLGF